MKKFPDYLYAFFILCIYFILKYQFISLAYLDFGDGNYLYISWRLSRGEILYRDIISPQPPVMLYFWSIWHRLIPELTARVHFFRAAAIFVHMAAGWMVFLLARLIFKNRVAGFLALVLYLMQPIGFWWFRCIQSEPLGIVFMLISTYFLLQPGRRNFLSGGIFSGLSVAVNMVFLPYFLLVALIILCYRPNQYKQFFLGSGGILAIIFCLMTILTGTDVWQQVFLNQFQTYTGQLPYYLNKLITFGGIIIHLEAAVIILFFFGLFHYMKQSTSSYSKVLLVLLSLQALGSYFFVTKGGTVDYIFSIAEPFLALFAAYALLTISRYFISLLRGQWPLLVKIICFIGLIHFLIVITYSPIQYNARTLRGENYEADVDTVTNLVSLIRRNTSRDDHILAPPYYAFLAERQIIENLSSTYIFHMKYLQEDPEARETMDELLEAVRNKQLPVILLNMNQLGTITPLREAVRKHYSRTDQIRTRHEYIEVYLPEED